MSVSGEFGDAFCAITGDLSAVKKLTVKIASQTAANPAHASGHGHNNSLTKVLNFEF